MVQQATGTSVGTTETYGLIVVAALVVVRQLLTLLENLDLLRKVREGQERLHHQAFHDWLTGLPNRALFRERLERAVEQHVGGGGRLAVLFFDLDDFKEVNDTLGHAAGDELLKVTAQRLRRGVRTATPSRGSAGTSSPWCCWRRPPIPPVRRSPPAKPFSRTWAGRWCWPGSR